MLHARDAEAVNSGHQLVDATLTRSVCLARIVLLENTCFQPVQPKAILFARHAPAADLGRLCRLTAQQLATQNAETVLFALQDIFVLATVQWTTTLSAISAPLAVQENFKSETAV